MSADLRGLRVGLVGPVPPPSGGMANQVLQLDRKLRDEGLQVTVVPVNAPYRPAWVGAVPGVRAGARLLPYAVALRRTAAGVDLFHVLASSGWAWHLFAAPAVWIGRARPIPVVVNYRGGGAAEFLGRSARWIRPTLRRASALVVPSEFLREVFRRHGFEARVVPNVVDVSRFSPGAAGDGAPGSAGPPGSGPRVLIARNLEPVYDIATGLRAFRLVRDAAPGARLAVAGSGPQGPYLESLARDLGVVDSVDFLGRVDNERMPELYRRADVALNPSLADNMPISILEALACGVPVVSTDVGGVPYLVRDGETALLTRPGDPRAMADSILRLHRDGDLARRQSRAGLDLVQRYTWPRVWERLAAVYAEALRPVRGA